MSQIPRFLDFEASSLAVNSYPIEVAWSLEDGSVEQHLISPAAFEGWTDWDPEAEKVHGISREELIVNGEPPEAVCVRMNRELFGETIYSDAALYDGMWLSKLFSVSVEVKPQFRLKQLDDLLIEMLSPNGAGVTFAQVRIDVLKREARRRHPRRHRAGWDVEYLVELWRLAAYEAAPR